MSSRTDLHNILVSILGSKNVYFQPPASKTMSYPCIVYKRNVIDIKKADNISYSTKIGYTVTVIDANPDSLIPLKLLDLPLCKFDRFYVADNLNHDVYTLYY